MAQVFVVVGAANVIAFIIRDLGQPAIVGWVIQVLPILFTHFCSNIDCTRVLFSFKQHYHLSLAAFQMSWTEDIWPPFHP